MRVSVSYNSKNLFLIFPLVLSLLYLSSCKKEDAVKGNSEKNNEKIHETIERGPARVILEIDKKKITIADRINLSISVYIDEDYEVELPAFGDKLEQFGIVDYHTSQPELMDNNIKLIKRTYILEPFLSGDYIHLSVVSALLRNQCRGF